MPIFSDEMKKLISLLTVLLASPAFCFAADWQRTAESSSGDTYAMDFSSVTSVGAYRKAWVQVFHKNPQQTDGYPKKKYQTTRLLYYFDCQAKTLSTFQTVRYEEQFARGDVVESKSFKFNPKELDDVVPDTVGETVLETACGSAGDRAKIKKRNDAEIARILKQLEEIDAQDKPVRRSDGADSEPTQNL